MPTYLMVLGILMFAVATAILYAWGLKKSVNQKAELEKLLYQRSANKVVSYLKKHDTITILQMQQLVKNVVAQEFYSKKRAIINDEKAYVKSLGQHMVEDKLIEKVLNNNATEYVLVKKDDKNDK